MATPNTTNNPGGPAVVASLPPSRTVPGYADRQTYTAFPGFGTGKDTGAPINDTVGFWNARWRRWRDGFEQSIGPKARRYWALYRAFDDGPLPGPNQEWRDRTVIPEAFKIIMTIVPRLVLPLWSNPENFTVEGRGFKDEGYEEMVRVLIQEALDEIGKGQPENEQFLLRMMNAEIYCQVMGHVWYRTLWREQHEWLRARIPSAVRADGSVQSWQTVEGMEKVYDNVDITWLTLDSLAVDLGGIGKNRRWAIERVLTSVEALEEEDEKYKKATGMPLYKNMEMLSRHWASPATTRESFEEPRDTEHWPLTADQITDDPGEEQIELWLCWDNIKRTLTKIANRSVVLAEGLAPTPDGKDPYIGAPAVPVPNRVYGDSILHWVGPLAQYQTRLARARADEVLLNIWQQYLYRAGSIRSTQWFWRPGGGMAIEQADPNQDISKDVKLLDRRPVFQEAWTEEGYRQSQAESTAGADALTQGTEATNKSRDVSATEISQRSMLGGNRHQFNHLYREMGLKKPLLQKVFDQLRMNLKEPKLIRITDDLEDRIPVDLRDIDRPIDITVGGGVAEATLQERLNELREVAGFASNPEFLRYMKTGEILKAILKATKTLRKNAGRYVKTQEEVDREQAKLAAQAAQQAALTQGQAGGAPPGQASGPKPNGDRSALPPAATPGQGDSLQGPQGSSQQTAGVPSGSARSASLEV